LGKRNIYLRMRSELRSVGKILIKSRLRKIESLGLCASNVGRCLIARDRLIPGYL
jgi:hypothetical protein